MHNGELQHGYVHKYENRHWSIKYVNDVPTKRGSRELILGDEAVDLADLESTYRDKMSG